jgi:mRNA interferase YafQ
MTMRHNSVFSDKRLKLHEIVTTAFRKDLKRMRKRGKDLGKLEAVVERLARGLELAARYKVHPLVGNWKPLWDLHIAPLLVLKHRWIQRVGLPSAGVSLATSLKGAKLQCVVIHPHVVQLLRLLVGAS